MAGKNKYGFFQRLFKKGFKKNINSNAYNQRKKKYKGIFSKSRKEYKDFMKMWNSLLREENLEKEEIKLIKEAKILLARILENLYYLSDNETLSKISNMNNEMDKAFEGYEGSRKSGVRLGVAQYEYISKIESLRKKQKKLHKVIDKGRIISVKTRQDFENFKKVLRELAKLGGKAKHIAKNIKKEWQDLSRDSFNEIQFMKDVWGYEFNILATKKTKEAVEKEKKVAEPVNKPENSINKKQGKALKYWP